MYVPSPCPRLTNLIDAVGIDLDEADELPGDDVYTVPRDSANLAGTPHPGQDVCNHQDHQVAVELRTVPKTSSRSPSWSESKQTRAVVALVMTILMKRAREPAPTL